MKTYIKFIVATAVIWSITSASYSQNEAKPATTAKAVKAEELASIDGVPITTADVERTLRVRYGPQIEAMPEEQRATAIKQATPQMAEELIARRLLLNAAKQKEEKPTDDAIAKAFNEVKGSMPPNMTFANYLKAAGHTEDTFKSELVEELLISSHVRAHLDTIPKADDKAIAEYYEKNKDTFATKESVNASHILLKTDAAAGEEGAGKQLDAINKLRTELIAAKGAGFDKLAKEHSDCPSGARGGDLGNFGRGQMVPEFEKAAFTQKIGTVGEVVKTNFGYHLIMVTARTEGGLQPLEKVKSQISQQIDGPKQQTAMRDYIQGLEKTAKVVRSAKITPPAPVPPAPQPEQKKGSE